MSQGGCKECTDCGKCKGKQKAESEEDIQKARKKHEPDDVQLYLADPPDCII